MPKDRTPAGDGFGKPDMKDTAGATGWHSVSPATPARLKSKIYSALVSHMEESGSLLPVEATEATHSLCVFEKLVELAPVSEGMKTFNACSVCHARVLAERFEHPPIYWKNCPYVDFKNG